MKLSNISASPLFYIAGVVVVGGLTLGTIMPSDTTLHHYLANHALGVMVFFLLTGFLGLVVRQNTVILFNFLACIAICSFLKEQKQTLSLPLTEERAPAPAELPMLPPKAVLTSYQMDTPTPQVQHPTAEAAPMLWVSTNP